MRSSIFAFAAGITPVRSAATARPKLEPHHRAPRPPASLPGRPPLLALLILAVAGLGLQACSPGTGEQGVRVEGRVVHGGEAPEAEALDFSSAPTCASLHPDPVEVRDLRLGPAGGLADALVVLRGLAAQAPPPPQEPVVLEQRGCLFHPRMVALRAGQPLLVRNLDPTYHEVVGEPEENPAFDLTQPFEGMETRLIFESPETMIRVRSGVHPWMEAWISVLPHPWFAVTQENGGFVLEGVPPGEYRLEVHHGELETVVRDLTVAAGEEAVSGLEVEVP